MNEEPIHTYDDNTSLASRDIPKKAPSGRLRIVGNTGIANDTRIYTGEGELLECVSALTLTVEAGGVVCANLDLVLPAIDVEAGKVEIHNLYELSKALRVAGLVVIDMQSGKQLGTTDVGMDEALDLLCDAELLEMVSVEARSLGEVGDARYLALRQLEAKYVGSDHVREYVEKKLAQWGIVEDEDVTV